MRTNDSRTTRRASRRRPTAAAVAALLTAAALTAAPSTASATVCPTGWGSTARTSLLHERGPLTEVRAGSHTCFDRIVVTVDGPVTGYDVRYVPEFRTDGEGRLVPARGGAKLQVVVRAAAHDDQYRPTFTPANPLEVVPTGGRQTLRQVVWLGSFEGQTSLGVGVRARLPFTVAVLPGPGAGSRVVVDIAHSW